MEMREAFDDAAGGWQHVGVPFLAVVDKLEGIFTRVRRLEDTIDVNIHRVLDECIEAFGLSPTYDLKFSILAKIYPFLEDGFDRCESPIEQIMLFGLLVTFATYFSETWSETADGFRFLTIGTRELGHVILGLQVDLGRYRVDFLLGAAGVAGNRRIVIECDGHDFHERTATQAQRDRSRDRWMQTEHGFIVLRFTGREIYGNTARCAGEIFDALLSLREGE